MDDTPVTKSKLKPKKATTSNSNRSYCFTINNYTEDDVKLIHERSIIEPCRYLVYGFEVGEKEGTPHLQGYVEFSKTVRMGWVSKNLLPRARLVPRYGTREEARDYCKKDNNYVEFGRWAKGGQGARTDLGELMADISIGKSEFQLMEDHPEVFSRNMRFAEKYFLHHERLNTPEFREVEVHVIWGDAGVGKSKLVRQLSPDVFRVQTKNKDFPFDGYDGHKEILFEDFYGDMPYKDMLDILDGFPIRLNVKYGSRYAQWDRVYITSNKPPDQWYNIGLTDAFSRRIAKINHMVSANPNRIKEDLAKKCVTTIVNVGESIDTELYNKQTQEIKDNLRNTQVNDTTIIERECDGTPYHRDEVAVIMDATPVTPDAIHLGICNSEGNLRNRPAITPVLPVLKPMPTPKPLPDNIYMTDQEMEEHLLWQRMKSGRF